MRSDMRSRSPKPERLQPRRKEKRSSPHHRKSDGPCEGLQLSAAPRHLREELKALSGTAIRQLVIDLMMELEDRSERRRETASIHGHRAVNSTDL